MSDANKKNSLTFLSAIVLILGFQNCGQSSFQDASLRPVEESQNLSSNSAVSDTEFKDGLEFTMMSLSIGETSLAPEFKVQKSTDSTYHITVGTSLHRCSFKSPNASEELLQISDISTLALPSTLDPDFDVCENNDDKEIFYRIGQQSPIFLIFQNEKENCYSGDPQKLTEQNKRVFVVENLFHADIDALIESAFQDILNKEDCQTTNFNVD